MKTSAHVGGGMTCATTFYALAKRGCATALRGATARALEFATH